MKKLRIVLLAILGLVVVLGLGVVYLLSPIGSGYSAKYLCSQLFVSKRPDARQVIQDEIDPTHPMFSLVSNRVDAAAQTVRSVTLGIFSPSTAVFRKGFGCTLAVGKTPEELRAQAAGYLPPSVPNATLEWPLGEKSDVADQFAAAPSGQVTAAGIRVDAGRLRAALDKAFSEPNPKNKRQTQVVAVVYRGRLIAERYAPGFSAATPVLGWSMSKTVTAALTGIMVADGKLDINKPAPVPEWKASPDKSVITMNHLLHMSSGLDFSEEYAPFMDAPEMLYNHSDMAHFAATKPLAHKPGTHWYYSSGDTNLVARILRMASGGTAALVQRFSRERLFGPLGMSTAVIEPDPSGTFVGSSYMYASARDWARMGLFLARDGVWNGKRILPAGWVTYMTTPAPDSDGVYGAQTWLNMGRDNPQAPSNYRFSRLPKNMFYFSGYNGQNVIVLPDQDLVVVRLGVTHDRKTWKIEALVVDVMESLGLTRGD